MNDKEEEKYFVGSSDNEPEKLFFTKESAFDSELLYIDSFGISGDKIESYMRIGETKHYTRDF